MTVARRLRELRTQQNLTYAAVSERLQELRHPIQSLSLRRMEEGERAVDVDDLMALSIVFGVAPVTLLLPDTTTNQDPVELTGDQDQVDALTAHVWARGIGSVRPDHRQFYAWANPEWLNMLAYSDGRNGGRLEFVTRGFDTTYLTRDDEDDD